MSETPFFKITTDDLSTFQSSTFVAFGETMMRDTPADMEWPERTRLVHLSMAGSEYILVVENGLRYKINHKDHKERGGVSLGLPTSTP